MLYNLKNGSTISISLDKYLSMSDEELDRLELYYRGAEINNPFFDSILEDEGEDTSGDDDDKSDADKEED